MAHRWPCILAALGALLVVLPRCTPAPDHEAQARRLVESMDLRTRAAQLVVTPLRADSAGAAELAMLAAARAIGGIWVEGGEPLEVARFVERVQISAAIPMLVAGPIDSGAPLEGSARFPAAAMIAALAAPEDAYVAGSVAGGEAAAAGVSMGFIRMPATNASVPLGFPARDPVRTADGLREFAEGAREVGITVGITALVGEGGGNPILLWDRARLDAIELRMLDALIDAEVGAVTLGPLRLPAITGDSTPLPFSAAAVQGLLRRQLGFDGIVAGDVGADSPLAERFGEQESAVRMLAAGHHLLLRVRDPAAVIAAIAAAVEDGRLPRAAIDSAAVRVVALRLRSAPARTAAPADSARQRIRAPAAVALAERLTQLVAAPALPAPASVLRSSPANLAGFDSSRLAEVDALLREALEDSVFTAAAVAIGRRAWITKLAGYGADVDPRETLFDLASLTKVIGTTTAVAILVDQGEMELDAPLERYLPEWSGDDKEDVTVRHLLTHTSGLPAGIWLFGSARSPVQAVRQAIAQPLIAPPGERVLYSDLGMILLAEAARRAAGEPLDRFLARHAFAPLGMQHTMYLPPLALAPRTIPTAADTERDFVLRGIVHDANAFRLGGVAGHAGLFSTARDLAVFAQTILNGGAYSTAAVISPETLADFTARQPRAENRALGWDTPADRSSAGRFFSANSFGHTGYTGTSVWIDPDLDLFVVLLTNRTFTDASATDILRVRAAVHEAVAQAVSDTVVTARPGARAVR